MGINFSKVLIVDVFKNKLRLLLTIFYSVNLMDLVIHDLRIQAQEKIFVEDFRKNPNLLLVLFS